MRRQGLTDALVLAVALLMFLCAAFYQVHLPGFYYDEAVDVVPAMQIALGDTRPLDMAYAVKGRLPAMVSPYIGAVSTYAVLPFYLLFGVGAESTRTMTIVLAAAGLVFAYLFLREFFDRRVAAATVLLAAVHPAFVFWSRMGVYVASPMLPLMTASLFCLWRWWQRKQTAYLYTAAFLIGLGLSTKLLFLWFVVVLILAGLILRQIPRLTWGRRNLGTPTAPLVTLRGALLATGFFLCGAWMIVLFNLRTQDTIKLMLRNMIRTEAGVNNLAVLANLNTQVKALVKMLDGSYFQRLSGGPAWVNWIMPLMFLAAVIVLIALMMRRALPWHWRRVAFVLLLVGIIWVESAFTITGLGPLHLYILYPFLQATIVLAALALAAHWRLPLVAAAIIAVVLVADAAALVDHHRMLSRSGGIGAFSEANYALAAELETRRGTVVAVDWGFKYNVIILTQGRVWPVEVSRPNPAAPQAQFADRIRPYLGRDDVLLVFWAPRRVSAATFLNTTTKLAADMGRRLVLDTTITQRDGTVTIHLYRTEPVSP